MGDNCYVTRKYYNRYQNMVCSQQWGVGRNVNTGAQSNLHKMTPPSPNCSKQEEEAATSAGFLSVDLNYSKAAVSFLPLKAFPITIN